MWIREDAPLAAPNATVLSLTIHSPGLPHSLTVELTASSVTVSGSEGGIVFTQQLQEINLTEARVWRVRGEEEVTIPLSRDVLHSFSFFSSQSSMPKMSLVPSDSPAVTLAWEKGRIVKAEEGRENYTEALPHDINHRVSLQCNRQKENVTCYLMPEEEARKLAAFVSQTFPSGFRVSGLPGSEFFVQYRHETYSQSQGVEATLQGGRRVTAGYVLSIVVIGLVFVGIIATVVVASVRHKPRKKRKMQLTFEDAAPQEYVPFLSGPEATVIDEAEEDAIQEEPTLWEAVKSGDVDAVEALLDEGFHPDDVEEGREITPILDAHFLGFKDVLDLMLKYKGERATLPTEDLIKSIVNELETRMKEVFVAAECGMYERERGVHQLLDTHMLPATITDHMGRSLIHYITSTTVMDGRPPWAPKDVKRFLNEHKYFINAVDHWGRTALHQVAEHPRTAEMDVIWEGKEWGVSEAWLELTKILLGYGCDPRIPDHRGILPHQLATHAGNHQMAQLLEDMSEKLGPLQEPTIEQHEELVTACRMGDTSRIRKLLRLNVPVLPMYARADPLREAIRHHQRDVLLLLLSAGAPLSSRHGSCITPLEAAHTQQGLPACFPAIMRKVTAERLEHEASRVSPDVEELKGLREGMRTYTQQILDVGIKARWILNSRCREERGKEARRLLAQAADLGLSLTCQLLSLEDVFLNPLPGEDSPVAMAVSRNHIDTQLTLCRDLGLSPFFSPGTESLHLKLQHELWLNERKRLEELYSLGDSDLANADWEYMRGMINTRKNKSSVGNTATLQQPSDSVLFFTAKQGLIVLLDIILRCVRDLDINRVVQTYSGSTALHVASMSNHIQTVEYLLHRGAEANRLARGNLDAAHVAALSGHRKCLEYLLECKEAGENDKNRKALHLMNEYEKMLSKCNIPILSHEDALSIMAEREEQSKAYLKLNTMAKSLDISAAENLIQVVKDRACAKRMYLAPPFASVTSEGVDVFWVLDGEPNLRLVKARITPVLLITQPDVEFQPKTLLEHHLDMNADVGLHLANIGKEWLYCTHALEKEVFGNLTLHKRSVWLTCRLIQNLLQSHWWSPDFSDQLNSAPWHTLAVGVETLPERGLRSLFLEELCESSEWEKRHVFHRVLSVFRRAAQRDMIGKWATRKHVGCFSFKSHWCANVPDSFLGILRYLEDLERLEALPKGPKVKFAS
ncbi:Rab2a protein [Penaeus vannamei]|uniref:Rab2a protein n=1 Tax=Penaeus vannamei TaxID=6689 RepID=A0A423SI76_PENVA|nr:Rab2a protein [Penaeus vannamei]